MANMISPKINQVLGSGIGAGRGGLMICASRFKLGFVVVGLELLMLSSFSTSAIPFLANWLKEIVPPRNCDSSLLGLLVVTFDVAGAEAVAGVVEVPVFPAWVGGVKAMPVFEPS
jgi:hypothetical protein